MVLAYMQVTITVYIIIYTIVQAYIQVTITSCISSYTIVRAYIQVSFRSIYAWRLSMTVSYYKGRFIRASLPQAAFNNVNNSLCVIYNHKVIRHYRYYYG